MEQTSWFDLLGNDVDPIYLELKKFSDGQTTVHIRPFTITKNRYDLYEIETEGIHDCVSTIEECYQYLCSYSKAVMS
ncbi:hypothetical protein LCL89_13085 [Halobacillus yeomjeoni]|uniref:Uncharacterized protein n=1 Tax=Halobacillus yeomjeoni TaxID=311194 RepID=A0A931MX17_9BACI|nr:hypothetical protein [Halobacillus yeomjeoni]MBH0231706.1 hypothetical protein [Halobacillus yeomjeoni]MCA0984971.1 hypothetical protein [Halobacillus yeomjeoni]